MPRRVLAPKTRERTFHAVHRPFHSRKAPPTPSNRTSIGRERTSNAAGRTPLDRHPAFHGCYPTPTAGERALLDRHRTFHDCERTPTVCARPRTVRHRPFITVNPRSIGGSGACPDVHRTSTERETALTYENYPSTRGKRPRHALSPTLSPGKRTSTGHYRIPTGEKPAPLHAPRIPAACRWTSISRNGTSMVRPTARSARHVTSGAGKHRSLAAALGSQTFAAAFVSKNFVETIGNGPLVPGNFGVLETSSPPWIHECPN